MDRGRMDRKLEEVLEEENLAIILLFPSTVKFDVKDLFWKAALRIECKDSDSVHLHLRER